MVSDKRNVGWRFECSVTCFSDSHLYKQDDYAGQEVFFILEGKAEVTVNDEKRIVEALSSCYCPPGSKHSIQKAGGDRLKFIVVRTK